MKFKKILSLILVLGFVSICMLFCGFTFFKKKVDKVQSVTSETLQNYSQVQSELWCVTFQLVWNQFMDKITGGKPVLFVGGNPQIAEELNKKAYTKDILDDASYYIAEGKISKTLKKEIEKSIKKKFNEKSEVLDYIDWTAKNSYLFYSMLKKEFNFSRAFDKLESSKFNDSAENVKYFGIDENSDNDLRHNLNVLFYNSKDEYAVRMLTKEKENIILFRTDKSDSFENLFSYVNKNSIIDEFTKKDNLKVPFLEVDKTLSYNDLIGKQVLGTKFVISQALQTIKFKLNEKGGSLKSEAILSVMKMSLAPEIDECRNFFFDKPFVLFLIEEGKDKPYYSMKIDSTEYIVKEK